MSDEFLPPQDVSFGEENAPENPPPDAFVGAFALLMRSEGPAQYLAVRTDDGLDLIRAHRGESMSYRDALVDEIGSRLGLDSKRDLVASGVPRAHLNSRLCGKGSGEPKWYICEFFVVRLFGKRWPDVLNNRDDIVWLTGAQIMEGGLADAPLARDVQELLKISEAIPPDER